MNLVKLLRTYNPDEAPPVVCFEAADEIERLTAENQTLRLDCLSAETQAGEHFDEVQMLRAELKEEKVIAKYHEAESNKWVNQITTLKAELAEAKQEAALNLLLYLNATECKEPMELKAQSEPVGYVDYGDRVEWYGERPANETDLYTQPTTADKDAERLDWIAKKFFVASWNGVVGSGCKTNWRIAGDYRHAAALLTENTFVNSIDRAMKEGK
jgi:hypothetical protein